jgi:hypothetical protein
MSLGASELGVPVFEKVTEMHVLDHAASVTGSDLNGRYLIRSIFKSLATTVSKKNE